MAVMVFWIAVYPAAGFAATMSGQGI
jgi:hypothetical protein